MRSSTSTFKASDGQPIFVYRWEPDAGAPVKAVVHVAHGMAEHAGRYERVAGELTCAGYVVYANDHRGHGKTPSEPRDIGFFTHERGWGRVLADLREMIDHEKSEHPGAPLVLLGHSMGSYMAQTFLYEYPDVLRGAVLSGSSGKPSPLAAAGRYVARVERIRVGDRGKSPVLKALTFDAFNKEFRPNRTAFDWLSRDPAEVDKYAADPRCGFACTTSLWIDVLDALGENARPENLARIPKDLPIYVVAGSDDPVGERGAGPKRLVDAYRAAGMYRLTLRLYDGARHEVFNETNRDEVTADLLAWLEKNISKGDRAGI